jgi:hypothetical protein
MSAATSSRTGNIGIPGGSRPGRHGLSEIHSNEPLTIEGEVEGTIDVTGQLLTIAPTSVNAREIDVLCSLHGNAEGFDKIYIRNGAQFVGDIQESAKKHSESRSWVALSLRTIFCFLTVRSSL